MHTNEFGAALRRAVTGRSDAPLVVLGNIEVEDRWALGTVGLPRIGSGASAAVVNRMDELALLLGRGDDVVVLKEAPDPGFLADLDEVGFDLPRIVVAHNRPEHSVTSDALADPSVVAELATLAPTHAIIAHGISDLEEQLAQVTGVPLAGPPADVVRHVNSKVWSRRLADAAGIPQPQGWSCATVDEWEAAISQAVPALETGPLVVKEGYGVSGKGLAVVTDERRLRRLGKLVASRARDSTDQLAFCIERWHDKALDINYQITVGRDGDIRFDFAKEALTAAGVHRGHRFPARLRPEHLEQITETAHVVGKALAAEGFYGVAGVDAITTTRGDLFALLEVNARHNMSTYQMPVQDRVLAQDKVVLARHYDIRAASPVPYDAVRSALGPHRLTAPGGVGVLVHGFATVNAAFALRQDDHDDAAASPVSGRLYTILVADDDEGLDTLDRAAQAALAQLEGTA